MSSGRDEQFRAYVVSSRAGLVRTATYLTAGDGHLAEDLVQTTLTRLYLAWPRIQQSDGPHGYARRVLVNALIDERRRPFWRRETARPSVPDLPVGGDEQPEFHVLRKALADLPPGMRAAVVLRHIDGLTVTETAAALNCTEGTVKSQTARGLDRLRDTLTASIRLASADISATPSPHRSI